MREIHALHILVLCLSVYVSCLTLAYSRQVSAGESVPEVHQALQKPSCSPSCDFSQFSLYLKEAGKWLNKGRIVKAAGWYNAIASNFEPKGEQESLVFADFLMGKAAVHEGLGEHRLSIQSLERACDHFQKFIHIEKNIECKISLGKNHLYIGDLLTAEYTLEDALKQSKSLNNDSLEGEALVYLSTLHIKKGKSLIGLEKLEQFLESRKNAPTQDHKLIRITEQRLIEFYLYVERIADAEKLIIKNLSDNKLTNEDKLYLTKLLAYVQNKTGFFEKSKTTLYQLEAESKIKTTDNYDQELMEQHSLLAFNALAREQWSDAWRYSSGVLDFYEKSLAPFETIGSDRFALKPYKDKQAQLETLLESTYQLLRSYEKTPFGIEKSSGWLSDTLKALQLHLYHHDSRTLVQRSLKLAGVDQQYSGHIEDIRDAIFIRDVSFDQHHLRGLFINENDLINEQGEEKLQLALFNAKTSWPAFSEMILGKLSDLGTVQVSLKPEQALLIYASFEQAAYVMLIKKNKKPIFKKIQLSKHELEEKVDRLIKSVTFVQIPGLNISSKPTFNSQVAYRLYEHTLRMLEPDLTDVKDILLMTDQGFSNLPFPAMITNPRDDGDENYSEFDWLIKRYSVTKLPTLGELIGPPTNSNDISTMDFIGFGDPVTDTVKELTQDSHYHNTVLELLNKSEIKVLQFSGVELGSIASIFKKYSKPELYTQLKNRESTFKYLEKKSRFSDGGYLAFSTHNIYISSISNDVLREESEGLLFSYPDSHFDIDDGLLTPYEISQLNLSLDWALLSACRTGYVDKTATGSRFSFLSRSFFYSGVDQLLVTLWDTYDLSSQVMMSYLFEELEGKDKRKSKALQKAMIRMIDNGVPIETHCHNLGQGLSGQFQCVKKYINKMIQKNEYAHPIYWAPYVNYGSGH